MISPPFVHVVRRFPLSEIGNGQTVKVPLDGCPTESGGRPLMITGFIIEGTIQYDAVAATMAAAMPGRLVLDGIQDVRLTVAGHNFIDGLAGGDLEFINAWRNAIDEDTNAPANIADSDATNGTVDVNWYIPLGQPAAKGKRRLDGVLPAAFFVGRGNEANQFTFRVASSFGENRQDGAFAGVTSDGFTALTVYALMQPVDKMRIPTAWTWKRYTTTQTDRLPIDGRHLGRIELVAMRNLFAGVPDVSNMTQLELWADGRRVFSDLSASELARGYGPLRNGYLPALTQDAEEFLPWVAYAPDHARTDMLRAQRIELRYQDTSSDNTRYDALVIANGVRDDNIHDAFAIAAGAPRDPMDVRKSDSSRIIEQTSTQDGKRTTIAAPYLDGEITWRGMPYELSNKIHEQTLAKLGASQ